jgi:hypothetical protein
MSSLLGLSEGRTEWRPFILKFVLLIFPERRRRFGERQIDHL